MDAEKNNFILFSNNRSIDIRFENITYDVEQRGGEFLKICYLKTPELSFLKKKNSDNVSNNQRRTSLTLNFLVVKKINIVYEKNATKGFMQDDIII